MSAASAPSPAVEVAPGTVVVYSDIGCPWAYVAVWRLHDARRRLRLTDAVRLDHRTFPLELFNSAPTSRPGPAELGMCMRLAPRAGWQPWSAPESSWPVTMLPPMEAVQAAKEQSLAASEDLDIGLRRAFWAESRCISLRHVILEVASQCDRVDLATLADAIDSGRARRRIFEQYEIAKTDAVQGSPHVFAGDGFDAQNPGLQLDWHQANGEWIPTLVADDAQIYERIMRQAAS